MPCLKYLQLLHHTHAWGLSAPQESHPVGIISIRDLLLAMTANQVVPLLDWLNEERRTLIEERVGYSE